MSKPPDKCYLQWWGDGEPDDFGEVSEHDVSWCKDKIYSHDIEYVRADAILELQSENARLRKELEAAKAAKDLCDEMIITGADVTYRQISITPKTWRYMVSGVTMGKTLSDWIKSLQALKEGK